MSVFLTISQDEVRKVLHDGNKEGNRPNICVVRERSNARSDGIGRWRSNVEGPQGMRAVIVILVLLLILGIVGWVQFGWEEGDPTLRLDTDKIKHDTSTMVEETNDLVGRPLR